MSGKRFRKRSKKGLTNELESDIIAKLFKPLARARRARKNFGRS